TALLIHVVALRRASPAFVVLVGEGSLAGFALGVEAVKLHLQAFFGGERSSARVGLIDMRASRSPQRAEDRHTSARFRQEWQSVDLPSKSGLGPGAPPSESGALYLSCAKPRCGRASSGVATSPGRTRRRGACS